MVNYNNWEGRTCEFSQMSRKYFQGYEENQASTLRQPGSSLRNISFYYYAHAFSYMIWKDIRKLGENASLKPGATVIL
jgi:hypothetical protein